MRCHVRSTTAVFLFVFLAMASVDLCELCYLTRKVKGRHAEKKKRRKKPWGGRNGYKRIEEGKEEDRGSTISDDGQCP